MTPSTLQASGAVDRDGVRIAYEVHGEGSTTVLLLPAWALATSGIWSRQVPVLAERARVVTFDPRGNGGSDRPTDPDLHASSVLVEDAIAVLDAVGASSAVVAGGSHGALLAYLLAALRPERVDGAVFIGPGSLNLDGRTDDPFAQALLQFHVELGVDDGWDRFNRRSWSRDFRGFVRWFVETAFPEPDAGDLRELAVRWGTQIRPEELAATLEGRLATPPSEAAARLRALAPAVVCPRLVIQGELDAIAPRHRAETLATVLEAPLVVVDGAGHCPQASRPGIVNPLLERFLAEVSARAVA